MPIRVPPPTASIATAPDETGKLHAPSAARNCANLCEVLRSIAPTSGHALEIASGTGQHIVAFSTAMPTLHWHPSDVDVARLNSIDAYVRDCGLTNVSKPIMLNATDPEWADTIKSNDLIVLINLLHLISKPEAETLIKEVARNLNPLGQLFIYGPFKRDGMLISDGDENFDASIRASDPEVGYKDDAWVKSATHQVGLDLVRAQEMPSNNLALIFRKL